MWQRRGVHATGVEGPERFQAGPWVARGGLAAYFSR